MYIVHVMASNVIELTKLIKRKIPSIAFMVIGLNLIRCDMF